MRTEIVNISKITINENNPRQITDDKFDKLVSSILSFPKMMELRPIVVDETYTVLGGNMRYRALELLAEMSDDEFKARLLANQMLTENEAGEHLAVMDYWKKWKQNPVARIIKASELSEAEKREFIIKDNLSYGKWDIEMLANGWGVDDLNNWGMDVPFSDTEVDPDDFLKIPKERKKSHGWLFVLTAEKNTRYEHLSGRNIEQTTLPGT